MNKQLKILQKVLNGVDNDVKLSLSFYNTTNAHEKSKYDMIYDTLHGIEHDLQAHGNCTEINSNVNKLLENLNQRYTGNQHLTWPSHLCHFHVSMKDWINCPFTCITEINEFVGKILIGD